MAFPCNICDARFDRAERLNAHRATASPAPCGECNQWFCHESRRHQHMITQHFGGGAAEAVAVRPPVNLDEPIIGLTTYQDRPEYQTIIQRHLAVIRSRETNRSNWRQVNRRIAPEFTYADLKGLLNKYI